MQEVLQQRKIWRLYWWKSGNYRSGSKTRWRRWIASKANISLSSKVLLFLFQSLLSVVRIASEYGSYFYFGFLYVFKNRLLLHPGKAFNFRLSKVQRDSQLLARTKKKQILAWDYLTKQHPSCLRNWSGKRVKSSLQG